MQEAHGAPCCLGMQLNCGLSESVEAYPETKAVSPMSMLIHCFVPPTSPWSGFQVYGFLDFSLTVLAVIFSPKFEVFLHLLQM